MSSQDMFVPERGVSLGVARTYNSQSRHDANNSDGSGQSIWGNGWTSNYDLRLTYNSTSNALSVWDASGARYDYYSDGQGHWTPPSGLHGTFLTLPGSNTGTYADNACYYQWTLKDGTAYIFASPNFASQGCGGAAYNGRLMAIYGRNSNNWARLNYYWNQNANSLNNLNALYVTHQDAQQLAIGFKAFGTHIQVYSVELVSGSYIGPQTTYWYDTSGNLTDVCLPGNGSTSASSPCAAGQNHYQYAYSSNSYRLAWVNSPNWVMSNYQCGTYQTYQYDTANRLTALVDNGTGNPYVQDGSTGGAATPGCSGAGSPVQTSYTGDYGSQQMQYYSATLTYGSGTTSFSDMKGHSSAWNYDGVGRVTQTQAWRSSSDTSPFVTQAVWDTDGLHNNDLNETIDVRNNTTDYGYDGSGNTIWLQEPWVQTAMGNGRPVARYSYDPNNNLTAACDPQYIWTTGATSCNPGSGVKSYVWSVPADGSEPYGQLVAITFPSQYTANVSYDPSSQGGSDYGLPTAVQGASGGLTQLDGTTRVPAIKLTYDGNGNPVTRDTGNGVWKIQYDQQNRSTVVSDPDNGSTTGTASGAQFTTSSYMCYYPNGQAWFTETAAQHSADGYTPGASTCSSTPADAVSYTYDADGNPLTEQRHFGCTSTCNNGATMRWYDGADRLVEVAMPHDTSDIFAYWLTRYDYDLGGSTSGAYGNLAAVQRYVPGPTQRSTSVSAAYQWTTTQTWTYDGLNRVTRRSYYSPGATSMSSDGWLWDTSGNGLLYDFTNAMGDVVYYGYDSLGDVTSRSFADNNSTNLYSGNLATENVSYDADGRVLSFDNGETGTAFYTYDANGNLATYTEPNAATSWSRPSSLGPIGPISSSAVKYNYSYYPDGVLAQVATPDNSTYREQYSYRNDGALATQAGIATWSQSGTALQASYTGTQTLTAAGRLQSKGSTFSDPCPVGQTCRTTMTACLGCPAGESLSVGYDVYGRNATWSIPSGKYAGFTYDLENEPTAFTTTPTNGGSAGTWTLSYSTRGELLNETNPFDSYGLASFRSAAGFLYSTTCSLDNSTGGDICPIQTFDTRTSTLLATSSGTAATQYSYDLAGRRTGNRQYDVLNRLLKASRAYAYGPGSIPYENGSLTQHGPLGRTPTFATDSSGNVVDVKFGMDADVLPTDSYTGITVYNRDPFGFVAAQSNKTGTSAWTVPDLFAGCDVTHAGDTGSQATAGFTGNMFNNCKSGGELYSYRTDGYFDGSLTFRGVRTYDADTRQWSTADAFGGSQADPISSLAYNYAANNPAIFVDPSGFNVTCMTITTTDDKGRITSVNFQCWDDGINAGEPLGYFAGLPWSAPTWYGGAGAPYWSHPKLVPAKCRSDYAGMRQNDDALLDFLGAATKDTDNGLASLLSDHPELGYDAKLGGLQLPSAGVSGARGVLKATAVVGGVAVIGGIVQDGLVSLSSMGRPTNQQYEQDLQSSGCPAP